LTMSSTRAAKYPLEAKTSTPASSSWRMVRFPRARSSRDAWVPVRERARP
jgi:hypothetical protein